MGRVEPGAFDIEVETAKRTRTLAFEHATLAQGGNARLRASVVLAQARASTPRQFEPAPQLGPPSTHSRMEELGDLAAFPRMLDYRVAAGIPGFGEPPVRSAG